MHASLKQCGHIHAHSYIERYLVFYFDTETKGNNDDNDGKLVGAVSDIFLAEVTVLMFCLLVLLDLIKPNLLMPLELPSTYLCLYGQQTYYKQSLIYAILTCVGTVMLTETPAHSQSRLHFLLVFVSLTVTPVCYQSPNFLLLSSPILSEPLWLTGYRQLRVGGTRASFLLLELAISCCLYDC